MNYWFVTYGTKRVQRLVLDDLHGVSVHVEGAGILEVVQLVQGGRVVDEAHVADIEDGLQVVADRALQVLEAVLVGQAEDVHDEVVLQLAEVDLPSVDVAEEELEGAERRVA